MIGEYLTTPVAVTKALATSNPLVALGSVDHCGSVCRSIGHGVIICFHFQGKRRGKIEKRWFEQGLLGGKDVWGSLDGNEWFSLILGVSGVA